MIELTRIVEHQASLSSYRATQNEDRAVQLELLIEITKPSNNHTKWHPLIATPFRYPPPFALARFRPPYGRNVFYGASTEETALYEHAFHFMKQRINLNIKTETGSRTIFFVDADDRTAVSIKNDINHLAIMDKNDYSASHQFINLKTNVTFIFYPSCRDPKQRDNAAILDILHLNNNINSEASINFFYDGIKKQVTWIDYSNLRIRWDEVS